MGRYGILLSFLLLTGCGAKSYHLVYTSKAPIRVYYFDPVTKQEVTCYKTFAGIDDVRIYAYYGQCNVYLEYPQSEKSNANIPGHRN